MKKILIVEDEKILREMYLKKLEKGEFEVFCVNSAEEGFSAAKKILPDLILLDIILPKGSGIDFLEKIRGEEKTKNIKVLTFSNFDDPETKKKAKEFGSLDYLIKTGYTPNQILKIIQNILKYEKNPN